MRAFRIIHRFQIFIVVTGLILALALKAQADLTRPFIEDFSIKDRDGTLICSLSLKNGLTDEIKKMDSQKAISGACVWRAQTYFNP